VVQFHEEGIFPYAAIADFLWAGLEAGESAVVITLPEHVVALRENLLGRGASLDELDRSGRLLARDAGAVVGVIMVDRVPDPGLFADLIGPLIDASIAASPTGTVRVYADCVALLAEEKNLEAAMLLEQLWNDLLATRSFSLYCAYPIQRFGHVAHAECFTRVCDLHDEVVPVLTSLETPDLHARCIAVLQQQGRALEAALRGLAEADRRKNEFLAMLGHELRNPLAPITTAVELMELRGDPRCQRERAVIRRQAAHLKRLVDDLLDIARITRGQIELHKESVELATVVGKAIELVSPTLERRSHALSVEVPRQGLLVHGDPTRLCQVFANLIGNAATYTDPGGRIVVAARRENDEIVAVVSDNGRGIRREMLSTIFDLFEQGDRALDRAQGGLGLGLALVKIFTELHGGTVSVESAGPGHGSTFTVRFPAFSGAEASRTATDRPEPSGGPPRSGLRVLIVDDNQDASDLLAETLASVGYETMVAYDGPEALRTVAESPPDVALIDIGLPVMDGYDLAARLREERPPSKLRLIALTGYGQDSDREQSRKVGFDLHLVKPVEFDALRRAIEAQTE
jgi:signal transduction histidine kinase